MSFEEQEVTFVSQEWEDLLRKVTAYHFDMTEEERAAVVTEFRCIR